MAGETLRRVVRRVRAALPQHVGELLIETPLHLWDGTLRAWQNDPGSPVPMPVGHAVFRDPEGCGFEDVTRDLEAGRRSLNDDEHAEH